MKIRMFDITAKETLFYDGDFVVYFTMICVSGLHGAEWWVDYFMINGKHLKVSKLKRESRKQGRTGKHSDI
jgi:hypothetical protein